MSRELKATKRKLGGYSPSRNFRALIVMFAAETKTALHAEKESRPRQKLIPHPKGQAGRSGGYKLQRAMRLGGNKPRYNRLMVCTGRVRHWVL